MIRDRREQDLGPLGDVLAALALPAAAASPEERLAHLVGREVELAWVFDQAPVTVVPTGHVVGHVALQRPPRAPADLNGPDEVLEVVQLFVAPGPHQHGIARFLLTEVVAHVRRLGATPVLDLRENVSLNRQLVERRGFVPLGGPSGAEKRFAHR
ncbi:GNAT family N-acetyltransferase [Nocardioides aurantiacus]|uniref:GNAT family N-acetyltransferase n=1 Tax=Nocardioides aurantiacus TaxID=86796 RepID=UPI00403F5F4C